MIQLFVDDEAVKSFQTYNEFRKWVNQNHIPEISTPDAEVLVLECHFDRNGCNLIAYGQTIKSYENPATMAEWLHLHEIMYVSNLIVRIQ